MIQNRVNVVFQPAGGSAADAIPAANQQVFLDLTPGTMSAASTNATGLLVAGAGAGTPVPLDDARDYSVVVLPSATGMPPAASAGTRLRVSSGRLAVPPKIAIRVTNAGAPVPALACRLTIGTTTTSVTTGSTGWILSNDQSSGAITLSTANRLLRLSTGTAPAATLAVATSPVTRGSTARINISVPSGVVNLHVTDWRYAISDTNPDSHAVTGTVIRPATEAAGTFDQFWEGVMCASGTVTALFVTGVTLRSAGAASVLAPVVAMDPQTATLAITVNARTWTTTLTQSPESTFTRAITTFHDTGHHNWDSAGFAVTPSTVSAGPNRGCHFAASTAGSFTSAPGINADVVNLASTFQSAQGSVRVLAPPSVRGRTLAPPLVTITGGSFTIPNSAAVATALGLTAAQIPQFSATLCISAADLLAGTRGHEHLGPISHKQNCLRALSALDPAAFIEGFIQGPTAPAINFTNLFNGRVTQVASVAPTHNEVDQAATRSAGALRFVSGSHLPVVNLSSGGTVLTVWNPATNSPLT